MPHEIKGFMLLVVIGGLIWWITKLLLNHEATGWMYGHNEYVKGLLYNRGLVLVEYFPESSAKCDTMYSICESPILDRKYLSSSETKFVINKIRTDNFSTDQVLKYYDMFGKKINVNPKF